MSDDDFMMDGDEDYGFEYEEDEPEKSDSIDLENQYYHAKSLKDQSDPKEALEAFAELLAFEKKSLLENSKGEKSEWGFKAIKQRCKILFKHNHLAQSLEAYREMLDYVSSGSCQGVTRNYTEKSITNLIEFMSQTRDLSFLEEFFKLSLDFLKQNPNERLWFKTNLKMATIMLEKRDHSGFTKLIRTLRKSCEASLASDTSNAASSATMPADEGKKGSQLLEVLALEIQFHTATHNLKMLDELYTQSLSVRSGMLHPKIMAVIRECGGKMHMRKGEFVKAQTDFFEAFKSYDEAGLVTRITCLKYLALANMLSQSAIDPFDSQETRAYKNDPEIVAMRDLLSAYQGNQLDTFDAILKSHGSALLADDFMARFVKELLGNIRTRALLQLIKPYSRVDLSFLAARLKVPRSDVENLLINLILDKKVHGVIDQQAGLLQLIDSEKERLENEKVYALEAWLDRIVNVYVNSTA